MNNREGDEIADVVVRIWRFCKKSASLPTINRYQGMVQMIFFCNFAVKIHCRFKMKRKAKAKTSEEMRSVAQLRKVDHVESGLPRWLLVAAFIGMLVQALEGWSPFSHWVREHIHWLQAIIDTFGPLILYYALMRGMRKLYRPMTKLWWLVLALNVAGFVTGLSSAFDVAALVVAVSLLLVYLPLGTAIGVCYKGRLQQVGIWMVLYILTGTIVPVVSALLVGNSSGTDNLLMEVLTVCVPLIYAWVIFRVVYRGIEQA